MSEGSRVPSPPRFVEQWLASVVAPLGPLGETMLGDLREEHGERLRSGDRVRAGLWYRRQALGLGARVLRDRVLRRGPFHVGSPVDRPARPRGESMRRLFHEFRQAWRGLTRAPQYAAAAVATLALAVAANTVVFSVVDSVLIEPLPYPDSNRLVHLRHTAPGVGFPELNISPGIYYQYRENATVFEESAIWREDMVNLTGGGHAPERVMMASATHGFFATLGVSPVLGRTYRPDEDVPNASPTVILSHGLWQSRFGGDPAVLGRTLNVDGVEREIIGVMPPRFTFPDPETRIWIPLGLDLPNSSGGNFAYNGLARLLPGVTEREARLQLDGLVRRMVEGEDNQALVSFLQSGGFASTLEPLKRAVVGDLERPLLILLGTAAFVLIIACANVTNLFLVRAETRQREIAVRSALGAGRAGLTRLFMAETLVIALLAGFVGTWLGVAGTSLLKWAKPSNLPRLHEVGVDASVVVYAAGLAAVVALLLALLPSLRLTSPRILAEVSRGGRATVGKERHRARQALVVVQTALALVLLAGSGLMLRTFAQLRSVDPGFNTNDLLLFRISLPAATYPDAARAAQLHETLLERLRALPGVQSAGAISAIPLQGQHTGSAFVAEGQTIEPGKLPPLTYYGFTSEDYFETMGIPLRGEGFRTSGQEANRRAVIVSQSVANRMWPGEDPIGRRLRNVGAEGDAGWSTVIGVAGDVRERALEFEPGEFLYFPMLAGPDGDTIATNEPVASTMTFAVRAPRPLSLAASVRQIVWGLDPDLPLSTLETMDDRVAASMASVSFTMVALAIAGGLALFLGAIGLYGVISYIVAQRSREIGLRLALGADAGRVRRMVVGQGVRLSALGLVAGGAAALGLTRLLESQLYGTAPNDPLTFVAVILLLGGVGFLASWVPARRASRLDPARTLQLE